MHPLPFKRAIAFGLGAVLAPALWAAPASATTGNTRLHNTHWTVQTVAGSPVNTNGARSDMHLVLRSGPQQLGGFAGCNRLRGRYTQRGTQLALTTAVAATRMSCAPALMQQEQRYLQALAAADSYRIEGTVLSLLQGEVVQVTFTARPAR